MVSLHPQVPFHRPRTAHAVALPGPRPAHRVRPGRTLAGDLALPLGAVAAALVVTALLLSGERSHTAVALAVLTLLTAVVAALARPLLMPAVPLVSWLFYDGFVLNQRSDLAFQQADRTGLLVLVAAGLVGAGCAAAVRAVRCHTGG